MSRENPNDEHKYGQFTSRETAKMQENIDNYMTLEMGTDFQIDGKKFRVGDMGKYTTENGKTLNNLQVMGPAEGETPGIKLMEAQGTNAFVISGESLKKFEITRPNPYTAEEEKALKAEEKRLTAENNQKRDREKIEEIKEDIDRIAA